MNKIHFIAYAIIIMLFSLLFFNQSKKAKVAIVDSQKVVREYEGFKEAQNFYENKLEEMKKNFEAKKAIYETKQNQLKIISNRLSKEELVEREAEIESLKGALLRFGEEIEK